jgi:glycosyltransferase involved in cell wall biosynthesis
VPEGVVRLLFAGRLSPEKGLLDVSRALELLTPEQRRRVRLRVVGGGIQQKDLHAATARIGDSVEFPGVRDRKGVAAETSEGDCLVLASVPMQTWEENQGLVVQEAMCSGVPVFTLRTGGLEEVVPPTSRGIQVPRGLRRRSRASCAA